ncbi:LOW QUALITY PROTEIN: hypothetical protein OSB04_004864 [Centaurea solstitialis]|uniref:B-block binding subunit of TFIIIC domain-containing protein n=1 Tax=Centaurea solstitialis TaxID=347529 RepID=A0AA38TGP0_9ASTR|nr:LOW QUALITY PROTEIN: hypothetical protein OSB04_004864 [Centaurea solstitialis]
MDMDMDAVVIGALEEICFQGVKGLIYPQPEDQAQDQQEGLTLHRLWHHLSSKSNGLHLCNNNNVKKALWSNLLNVQTLRFQYDGVSYDAGSPMIQSLEDAERMELKILAPEHLLKSFVGIHHHDVPHQYHPLLYRIAIARFVCLFVSSNNNLPSIITHKKEADGVTQNDLAKELGIENKNIFYKLKILESRGLIVRQSTLIRSKKVGNEGEYENGSTMNTNTLYLYRYAPHLGSLQRREITKEDKDGYIEQGIKEDVHVKDYEPYLRAICDKLEKANHKVLVVSDIKRELGYCKTSGHRAWRNILHKLKDAGLVEEFYATMNNKKVICLRLLKKFSPKSFAHKSYGGGDDDIDAEQHVKPAKRGQITEQLMELPIKQRIYDMIDAEGSKGLLLNEAFLEPHWQYDYEVYKRLGIKNKPYSPVILDMVSRSWIHLAKERLNRGVVNRAWTSRNFNTESSSTLRGKSKDIIDEKVSTHAQVVSLEISSSASPPPEVDARIESIHKGSNGYSKNYSRTEYEACQAISKQSLSFPFLQEKKVLIEPELRSQLENLEKKRTVRDKKMLERSLNKLQEEGHCKCISLAISDHKRTINVVLHPSVYNAQDLLDRVQERLKSIPVLNGAQRINVVKDQTETHEAKQNNGFLSAKMLQKHKSERAKSAKEPGSHPSIPTPPSYKRKRSSKEKPVNNRMENVDEELGKLKHAKMFIANNVTEERTTALEDDEMHISIDELDGQKEVVDDLEQNASEDGHSHPTIHKYARRKRFAWTENKDRQLVTEYVRNRASLGEKFHCTDWASLQSLPAPPHTCRRRMSTLNRNSQFRKAVTRLCNMLSVRYAKLLESSKNRPLGEHRNGFLNTKERWDDFDDKDIKMVLDEVLRYKHVTKSKATKGYGVLMNGGKGFRTLTDISLTDSNAIELLKLVCLSRKAPNLLLAETSYQYSEDDMQTAFNYLRDRNFMKVSIPTCKWIFGMQVKGGRISDVFTRNRCSSPFPLNTRERAVKMAEWVRERESDLLHEGVDLYADVQCGDVLQLCVLIIGVPLPSRGRCWEIEDLKKRDRGDDHFEKAKKPKLLDSEIFSRKDKGFPGIKLSLSRNTIPKVDAITSFLFGSGSGSSLEHELSKGASLNGKSKWEDMACYAKHLTSLEVSPFLFQDVYSAIQEGGDQGLTMEGIFNMVEDVQKGEKIAELVVEVLEAFGCALKVNGYDSVQFVDSKYRSKYFLLASSHQKHLDRKTKENHVHKSSDKIQRVAILNHHAEEVVMDTLVPILPWVDVDGTINENVYKGLVRRLLGIVMQNPGILEEHILGHMNVLNPQSCRRLLEEMILDGHITVRKMYESISNGSPPILVGSKKPKMVTVYRQHFFANPKSISYL